MASTGRMAIDGRVSEPTTGAGGLRLGSPRMAVALGASWVLLFASLFPLAGFAHHFSAASSGVLLAPFTAVGVLVGYRQPRNPIGWIMLAAAIVFLIGTDAGLYAVLDYTDGHRGLPLGRLAVALAPGWVVIMLLPLPILLFPYGRFPTGRWRATVWTYGVVAALWLVDTAVKDLGAFTDQRLLIDASGNLTSLDKAGVTGALTAVWAALALSWVVKQVLALRHATGDRRAQLKWLISGGAISIVGLFASFIVGEGGSSFAQYLSDVLLAGVIALPVSIGVGILKYRLYEIDRLVSRTVSYAVLSALLVGTFVGLVALTTELLPLSSSVGVAASTLAAAALFNPLRKRVQRVVDRRFNRARYDAEATVAAFAARLRDAVELDAIRSDLLDAVNQAVQPSRASVWMTPRARD